MVTRRHIHRVCMGLGALRTLLVLAVLLSIVVLWETVPQPPLLEPTKVVAAPFAAAVNDRPDLAWYAPLWERDLKQPPVPPNVAKHPAESRPPTGPVPKLVATMVEPKARYAHLVDRSGRMQLKGLGEAIDRFHLRAIEPGRVQLEQGDRSVWVEIPKGRERR